MLSCNKIISEISTTYRARLVTVINLPSLLEESSKKQYSTCGKSNKCNYPKQEESGAPTCESKCRSVKVVKSECKEKKYPPGDEERCSEVMAPALKMRPPKKPIPPCFVPSPCYKGAYPKPTCSYTFEDTGMSMLARKILMALGTILAAGIIYASLKKDQLLEEMPRVKGQKAKRVSKRNKPVEPVPEAASDFPDEVPYILIGGGAASFAAFRAIKIKDPKAKILVISNEIYIPYMKPPLSKDLWYNEDRQSARQLQYEQLNGVSRSVYFEPEEFYISLDNLLNSENGGVAVARGWNIASVNPQGKFITLEGGRKIKYDKCLIATGSSPKKLPYTEDLSEEVQERITYYQSIFDFEELDDIIQGGAKSIVICGDGFLGTELAYALKKRGEKTNLEVTQIIQSSGVLSEVIPTYLSDWLRKKMESRGIKFVTNSIVDEILMDKDALKVLISNGERVEADQVLVCIGNEPNTGIAKKSGLEIDNCLGGFVANAELVARADLYVAGDCASYFDPELGARRNVRHHDNAITTGRVAGENMTGERKILDKQPIFWSDLGEDLTYEGVGMVDPQLPTVGVFAKAPNKVLPSPDDPSDTENDADEDYSKGVIFYLKNNIVVGILLWNIPNMIPTATQVLKRHKVYDDLNEVAKLFNIHREKESSSN